MLVVRREKKMKEKRVVTAPPRANPRPRLDAEARRGEGMGVYEAAREMPASDKREGEGERREMQAEAVVSL